MIGQTLLHYRIVEKLGGGGMGVVYRAEDTKLRRSVALKFLPPELTRDDEARRRFLLEAQSASALDHPNICTIHAIDETPEGQLFLAMAFYEGETLKHAIERGPLRLDAALDYAIQVAQALVKAHAAGIIHRDIKPANIFVTTDDLVKVLDFGLAKLVGQTGITRTGTTLGTVAYMAPEQTRGEAVDARTDVWALGVLLYEMIAGQLPFKGDSSVAVATAIAGAAPAPLTSLRTGIPLDLERIVSRAMSKAPGDRYQTAADLLSELRRFKRESDSQPTVVAATSGVGPAGAARRRWPAIGAGAGLLAVAAAAVAYFSMGGGGSRSPVPRLINPVLVAGSVSVETMPAWSPDGQTVAFLSDQAGQDDIWVAQVGGGPPVNRTQDADRENAPRWSPDGRHIAFWSTRDGGGYFVAPALGGTPRLVASTAGAAAAASATGPLASLGGAAWSPDGAELGYPILDGTNVMLERRNLQTGQTSRVPLPGRTGNQRMDLSWSPDGRFVAYIDARNETSQVGQVWVVRLVDGKATPLTDGRTNDWTPGWMPDSRTLLYVSNRGGTSDLWLQRVAEDGTPDGAAERVTTGLDIMAASVSADGKRLAYAKGRAVSNVWRLPIRSGRAVEWTDATQLTFDQAHVEFLSLSPDGQRLALTSDRAGNPDIWLMPASGGELQPFAGDPTPDWAPSWSPDGRELVFYAYRSGNRELWVQPVAGGPARQLTRGEKESVYPRFSPDGQTIVYVSRQGATEDIFTLPAAGGTPRLLAGGPAAESSPDWSPDGQSVAFYSSRSGARAIHIVAREGGEPRRIAGRAPMAVRWAPDGLIYFLARDDGQAWSVDPRTGTERQITNLVGRRGNIDVNAFGVTGGYVYVGWREDVSDIWVMDIAADGR